MNAKEQARAIIDDLLQKAEAAAKTEDFKAWQAAHPEREAELAAMTHEEKTQEIIRLLKELDIIPPEPQKDDAAEAMPDFDSLTPEQQEAASLMLAGFDKALEEIPEGDYSVEADLIASMYGADKGSPFHFMAMGYVAGVCHGMRAGSCSAETENA